MEIVVKEEKGNAAEGGWWHSKLATKDFHFNDDGFEEKFKVVIKEEEECLIDDFNLSENEDLKPEINIDNGNEKLAKNAFPADAKDGFHCYYCSLPFNKLWILKKHIKQKHIKHFTTCDDLKSHLMSLLSNPNSVYECVKPSQIKKRKLKKIKNYQCTVCEYKTNLLGNLKRHERANHTIIKPYQCILCNYSSGRSDSLRSHIMHNHTEKRLHQCDDCNFKTVYIHHLTRHIERQHTGHSNKKKGKNTEYKSKDHTKFVWQCKLCDYKSNYKYEVDRHMNRKHGDKQHQCPFCSYKTGYNNDLQRHIASLHTNCKPYQCKFCKYKTAIPSHLNRHMKSKKHKIFMLTDKKII